MAARRGHTVQPPSERDRQMDGRIAALLYAPTVGRRHNNYQLSG